jgi:hypothetical protein
MPAPRRSLGRAGSQPRRRRTRGVRAPFPQPSKQKPEPANAGSDGIATRGWNRSWLTLTAVCAFLMAPEPAFLPGAQDQLPATGGCSMGERIPLVKSHGAAAPMPDTYLRACVEPLDGNRVVGVLRVEYLNSQSYEAKVDWRIELRSCNRKEPVGPPNAGRQERFHNESPFTRNTEPVGWNNGVRAKAKLVGISVRDAVGTQWESVNPVITETPLCNKPTKPSRAPTEPSTPSTTPPHGFLIAPAR